MNEKIISGLIRKRPASPDKSYIFVHDQEFADSRRDGSGAGSRGSKDDDFMNIPDNVEDEGLPFN